MPSPLVAQGLNKAARLHVGFEVIMRKRAIKYINDSCVHFDIDDGFTQFNPKTYVTPVKLHTPALNNQIQS